MESRRRRRVLSVRKLPVGKNAHGASESRLCNALYLKGESKLPHPRVKWRWARRLRIPATQNL